MAARMCGGDRRRHDDFRMIISIGRMSRSRRGDLLHRSGRGTEDVAGDGRRCGLPGRGGVCCLCWSIVAADVRIHVNGETEQPSWQVVQIRNRLPR